MQNITVRRAGRLARRNPVSVIRIIASMECDLKCSESLPGGLWNGAPAIQ